MDLVEIAVALGVFAFIGILVLRWVLQAYRKAKDFIGVFL